MFGARVAAGGGDDGQTGEDGDQPQCGATLTQKSAS